MDHSESHSKFERMFERIRQELADLDIDIDMRPDDFEAARVKAFAFIPELVDSVKEMAGAPRDQVVMVRLDQESTLALDDWVKAGAVKSRSEAAALFIREGLRVRAAELDQLRDALDEVEQAQARLREKAAEVFGDDDVIEVEADVTADDASTADVWIESIDATADEDATAGDMGDDGSDEDPPAMA